MTSAPTVTLIVRSMGRPCLHDAVASVDQQQYRSIELLVVDASGGRHPPLPATPNLLHAKVIGTGRPLSRPAAANFGLQHATGEWIGFLDDDDLIEPTHVARLVARSDEPDHPTLVYGQLWGLDRFHRIVHDRYHGFNPLVMYYYCRTPGMSCILHRSLRDAGHRLDETLETSEDWEFWLRLLPHAKVATVREPTHFYFMEAGTSGTGWGRNRHASENQQRCHDTVVARYARERDRVWRAYFTRLEQGTALHEAGSIDTAVAVYAEALLAYPDEPNALYLLGKAYDAMGRLQVARLLLRDALYLNGDAAPYHLALGQVCEKLQAFDEARDAYANAARFDAGLHSVVDEALARMPMRLAGPGEPAEGAVQTVSRNAACPCGSGLRYKTCHGALRSVRTPTVTHVPNASELRARGLLAAQMGDNGTAQDLYGKVLAQEPSDAEALHALGLLEFDTGDVDCAAKHMNDAVEHAPGDPQIAADRQRLRLHLHERAAAARAYGELAGLPFLVPSTAKLPAPPGASDVHLVVAFRDPHGDRESAALELAQVLANHVPVTVWSCCPIVAPRLGACGMREIDVGGRVFPRSGALIFVGLEPLPPSWLKGCAASRIVVVHDSDQAALLLDLVSAAHEASSCPVQVVTPSEVFRRRCAIPAVSCPLPLALERFLRLDTDSAARPFTVGRRSRNDHRLFHSNDPALFRRLAKSGMAVRILGGTVLMRHFPPSQPAAGVELLPADALSPDAFLREIDCVFYRTSALHPEPSGQSIAEALAAGIPVVCARDVGYSELISHGIDGFVFDRDDDEAARRHLASLRADVALRRRMSRAARAKAEAIFGPALHHRLRRIYVGERVVAREMPTMRADAEGTRA